MEEIQLVSKSVKIKLYGEESVIEVTPDENVLSSAMMNGLEPPFSCQIGACSTCMAKLKSGRVIMDDQDALTDEEIAQGYVLTCQAHPLTDDVYIDYDF